jgi:hypothetical protein
MRGFATFPVMVGLVPTIYVLRVERYERDVDARHKGEHDGGRSAPSPNAFPQAERGCRAQPLPLAKLV